MVALFSSLIALGLNSVRSKKMSYKEALQNGRQFALRLVGLGFCAGVLILLGLLLFIVPGIFMYRRYILAPYYLVDKNLGIFDAMRQSAADSKEFSGPVWGLVGVTILLSLVGNIPIIGLAASVGQILYAFAPAKRYDEVQKALGHSQVPKKHHVKAAA